MIYYEKTSFMMPAQHCPQNRAKAAAQGHYSELIKALHSYDYR